MVGSVARGVSIGSRIEGRRFSEKAVSSRVSKRAVLGQSREVASRGFPRGFSLHAVVLHRVHAVGSLA